MKSINKVRNLNLGKEKVSKKLNIGKEKGLQKKVRNRKNKKW